MTCSWRKLQVSPGLCETVGYPVPTPQVSDEAKGATSTKYERTRTENPTPGSSPAIFPALVGRYGVPRHAE